MQRQDAEMALLVPSNALNNGNVKVTVRLLAGSEALVTKVDSGSCFQDESVSSFKSLSLSVSLCSSYC